MSQYPGLALKSAITSEKPLQIAGVINAYAARLAQIAGFKAIYLSGAGVANAKFALPDLAMTSLNDVLEEVEHITQASHLPLLVDADTGWGSPLNVKRTFKLLSRAGAAGAHIEDQAEAKRCGHRGGKHLVSATEMSVRIKAALDGREYDSFIVMARTDAIAVEGEDKALERALLYQETGADAIFVEAALSIAQYQKFSQALKVPILANITEFGKTPLFSRSDLKKAGVSMILYPLSAFRAMNAAALNVFSTILEEGTQQSLLNSMQSRDDLYQCLRYEKFEKEIDSYLKLMEGQDGNH